MTAPREDEDDGWWDTDWDDESEPDADERCHWCDDGWRECRDPIECTRPHNAWGECQCDSCGGSGRADDMTIW